MTGGGIDQLTEAQRACLRLVLTHHNSKEIAAIVGVSPSAIDKRIERAIQILGVGTRFEAARRLQDHERGQHDGSVLTRERPADLTRERSDDAPPRSPSQPRGDRPGLDESAPDAWDPSRDRPPAYERLPSEPFDVPNPPAQPAENDQIEPWGLVRRFLGLSQRSGSMGTARNRVSVGDRMVRLVGLVGLIAVTTMALVNMAMTLTSLLRSNRAHAAPIHGTVTTGPTGRSSMLKQRREATDRVTSEFLKAEAAVDQAAMLAASCVSTLLQQRVAANLPVGTGVAALQMVSQASLDIINARQRFVDAHRALLEVRTEIGMGQFYGYGDTAECPPNEGALRAETPVRLAVVA